MEDLNEPLTKQEALDIVNKRLNATGVIDVDVLCELLTWQTKLVLWVLQDKAKQQPKSKENTL